MGLFKVELSRSAEKDLLALDKTVVSRIWPKVKGLSENPLPKGSLKLSGTDYTYRIRVGDYRIVYKVIGDNVSVIGIAHRKQAYR